MDNPISFSPTDNDNRYLKRPAVHRVNIAALCTRILQIIARLYGKATSALLYVLQDDQQSPVNQFDREIRYM